MTKPKIGDLRIRKGFCVTVAEEKQYPWSDWVWLADFEFSRHAKLFIKALKQSRRGKK